MPGSRFLVRSRKDKAVIRMSEHPLKKKSEPFDARQDMFFLADIAGLKASYLSVNRVAAARITRSKGRNIHTILLIKS